MARRKRGGERIRVGKVTLFLHHNTWWIYFSEGTHRVRRKIGPDQKEAEIVAAQTNLQLTQSAPTAFSFQPLSVAELRKHFLDYHEHVLKSSVGTLNRYRAATRHLEDFATWQRRVPEAHEVRPDAFASYLRQTDVSPNGHKHAKKRKLRDKGVRFILETCRSMYNFAVKRRHLPPYMSNPFSELPLDRFRIEDAKPIFVFNEATELSFFKAASDWCFPIHFTLAKTGMRIGELTHLLIEDLDLEGGWLFVRNKTELGWRIKTGHERAIPLLAEVVSMLRSVIGSRKAGPVFLREKLIGKTPKVVGGRADMEVVLQDRISKARTAESTLSRAALQDLAHKVWWDAGQVKSDMVRKSFIGVMTQIGHPEATCPKSWRHSFATLLQDANVDPLIRQQTLGHKPTNGNGLGMTGNYTHTRPETQRQQIEQAIRRWPGALEYAISRVGAF